LKHYQCKNSVKWASSIIPKHALSLK
jgi:hypothetical protein